MFFQIEKVLLEHNNVLTSKRLIPSLIIANEESANNVNNELLKKLALKHIGDPSIRAKWSIPKGKDEDLANLEEAREIMLTWVKKEFITLFFDKCVDEPSRKAYWLERVNIINDFKIYTTRFVHEMILSKDPVLSEFLDANVIVLRNESYAKHAALLLRIGNFFIIEFSDVGAIYIYKKGSIYARNIEIGNITYLKELKRPNLDYLNALNYMMMKEEGRVLHNSGWEKRMDGWLDNFNLL